MDFGRFGGKIVDTYFNGPVSYGFETHTRRGNLTKSDAGDLSYCFPHSAGAVGTCIGDRQRGGAGTT